MSIIDPNQYDSQCPLGDGEGTLEHYLTVCIASRQWRLKLSEKYLESERDPPAWGDIIRNETPSVLALLDHTSLGTHAFVQSRDKPFRKPYHKFWKASSTGVLRCQLLGAWDDRPYRPPRTRPPPVHEGPELYLASHPQQVIPDQSFGNKRKLPPLEWHQHAIPRLPANPLAVAEVPPDSPARIAYARPRRSARLAERAPPSPDSPWQPPGRPPERSSSPVRGDLDLILPQYDLRQLERWALGLTQTEPD